MPKGTDRTDELLALMRERILVFDGAMGTMLQSRDLGPEDFGGAEFEGCNENLVVTRPDVILDVHRAYLAAGADLIETDTFSGTPVVLSEYGLAERARELNRMGRRTRGSGGNRDRHRRSAAVRGRLHGTDQQGHQRHRRDHLRRACRWASPNRPRGLLEGGVDLFAVETCQDTRNTKAALIAVEAVCREAGVTRPVIVSGTIELNGTMLGGQTAEAFVASIEHVRPLAIGLNCATGPEFMTDHLRSVHEMAACAVSCYPNAGLPDEDGLYPETPESLAAKLERFADAGWLNFVGGCCGTTEKHIAALAAMVDGKAPRPLPEKRSSRVFFSGIDLVESTEDNRPLLVGERTNVLGSAKFRRLVTGESWDEAAEIGRAQVKAGAQIVDVCLTTTERDELADIREFYDRLTRSVKAPLMIDTTDPAAVELALTYCQGRAIVNSINLEDGEERFERICPLLRRYGAAAVVGTIDESPDDAQAFSRERKLEVALRSHELLTGKYGLSDRDLVFDPLVFPAASGDAAYIGGAVETIEGLRLIKEALARLPDRARDLQRQLRAAAGGARGGQLGLSLSLHQGRARSRHRQQPGHRALRQDPGRGAARGGGAAVQLSVDGRTLATGANKRPNNARPSIRPTSPGSPSASAGSNAIGRDPPMIFPSTSGSPATSSTAPATGSPPISTASSPKARRRSTSSTAR